MTPRASPPYQWDQYFFSPYFLRPNISGINNIPVGKTKLNNLIRINYVNINKGNNKGYYSNNPVCGKI